ncbi:unnamed protein product, partial [Prorocentrum cordatum]
MVALLGKEQTTDDVKKAYCEKEIDTAEDEKKQLDINIADLGKAIATAKESVATLAEEIAALLKGIKDLDASVKEATETRQEENALYKKTMQEDTAAKDILSMAKNRLSKFYAPKMYPACLAAHTPYSENAFARPPRGEMVQWLRTSGGDLWPCMRWFSSGAGYSEPLSEAPPDATILDIA